VASIAATAATGRPLRKDAARNRARILAAAADAFAELGLEVGVDEIARRSGVGMGTLYRHFPTKDALIDAILEERFAEVTALAREAVEHPDPWEGFTVFLTRVVELQAADRGFKDLLGARLREESALATARAKLDRLLRRLVVRTQAAGALRDDVSVGDVRVLLWATGRVVECSESVASGQWRRFLALVLDGWRSENPSPLPERALTNTQQSRALTQLVATRTPGGRR
jgi:AcrR family transcriptional regulator